MECDVGLAALDPERRLMVLVMWHLTSILCTVKDSLMVKDALLRLL
jgi:hypothetical protein